MKVKVEDGCIGCGLCVGTCPEVFRMTDASLAEVFVQPDSSNEASAQEAVENCPVNVIVIEN